MARDSDTIPKTDYHPAGDQPKVYGFNSGLLFFILHFKPTQNFQVFIDDRFGVTIGNFA
jgi:hypothetical protein